jgi:phospholipase C
MTGRRSAATIGAVVLGALIATGQLGTAAAATGRGAQAAGHHGSHASAGHDGSHMPTTPIRHFVVLLQENHTFDNYFGTYPGADGFPRGVCMPVNLANGPRPCVRPFHIGNRSIVDLDHSELSARHDLDGGKMDGFVAAQRLRSIDAKQAMGYYNGSDLPFYWNMADRYVLFDHFFSSALGGSFINHVYWMAAGTGNSNDSVPHGGLKVTTIFDRLQQAGLSWKIYVQNYDPSISYRTLRRLANPNRASQAVWVPLLDIPRFLDNPVLRSHIVDLSEYYRDLRDGTLPDVSYIAPSGASEHPPGSLATGQRFVRGLVNSLMASELWNKSAFMMAYDDWGGWYDHVRPPHRDAHGDGFRVPALLVSAYARTDYIDHTALDFTSMVKFIEQNWRLRPLTRLDAAAGSIMGAFDFAQPPRKAEIIPLQRFTPPPPARRVRDVVLYGLYGVGVLFALGLVVAAALRPVRRRRGHAVTLRSEGEAT